MKQKNEKVGYVVCQPGYEYNDEVFYRQSDDAISEGLGKIYLNQKEAEKECNEISVSNWSNLNICEFGYSIDELLLDEKDFGEKDLKIFIEEIGGEIHDEWDWRTPSPMKIEDINFIESKTYLGFAYVQELEIV